MAEMDAVEAMDGLNDRSAYQGCFACGARNGAGLGLTFRREGEAVVTEFTLDERFQGFPGVAHGGVLATALDETLNRLASLESRWMMTARLEVRYRSAALIGQRLRCVARATASRARMLNAVGEIRLAEAPETVIATAEGTFLPVPEQYRRDAVERNPALAEFFELGR